MRSLNYLRFEISEEGIRPGKNKIRSLIEYPLPQNIKAIRS